MKVYNYSIPQKALGHITPIAALKRWQKEAPQLFNKKVYDLAEPDINFIAEESRPLPEATDERLSAYLQENSGKFYLVTPED
jgi:hypothetical protein